MRNRDIVSSLIWMCLGGLFAAGAWQQGLMRRGVPGPGFLPFFSGLALVLVSLAVLVPALARARETEHAGFFPERDSPRRVLVALAALFGFGIALEYLGYLLSTLLFMLVVAQVIERRSWGAVAALASLTAVLSYLLFVVLLEVQLPKGVFGF
jgi:putative tricarboxylic transport membrane protein